MVWSCLRGVYPSCWAAWELNVDKVVLVVKNLPADIGDIRDVGSISGSGRSSGGGHDHSLQYSCLKNPMDRGAWWATDHGVTRVGPDLATSTFSHIITEVNTSYYNINTLLPEKFKFVILKDFI